MRVTAAVPCYNGERFIAHTVASLLNQTREADEIIVVDDGSTDGSADVVAGMGPPVLLVRHEVNQGLAAARNTAIQHANGDIIVFVDVDAPADSGMIQALLAEYTSDEIGAVGGQGIEVNIETVYDRWRRKYLSQTSGDRRIVGRGWIGGLCSSFRKEALEKIGGFDPFYRTNAEDHDISYRLRKAGYVLVYTPHAKVYHRRTDDWHSLRDMVYRYWYWRHVVLKRNGIRPPLGRYTYEAVRDCLRGIQRDLLEDHEAGMAALDLALLPVKLLAMGRAAVEYRHLAAHLSPD